MNRNQGKTMKLTSSIALEMIKSIEVLQHQIEEVYAEARSYDGKNNDNVLRDALEARAAERAAAEGAQIYLSSFDAEEE